MRMSAIAVASVVACSVLTAGPLAVADDVNQTGQSQTDDSGKSGTATPGENADTMGGGNTTSTLPSQMPQQAPPSGAPGGAKTNAEAKEPQSKH